MYTRVHGREYANASAMNARIADLNVKDALYGVSDGRETERNDLKEAVVRQAAIEHNLIIQQRQPYYVYFRTADGRKGFKRFASRKAQMRFIDTTNHACTSYN